jgi:hypothetical protein
LKIKTFIFVFSLISFLITTCTYGQRNHLGTWEGESDTKETIRIIFRDNGKSELYLSRRGYQKTDYWIDYAKNPHWLDFSLFYVTKDTLTRALYIAKFVNESELHIGAPVYAHNERPPNFLPENIGELWILKRIISEKQIFK